MTGSATNGASTLAFDIVVAADRSGGIGRDGQLPWHLPGDLAYFRRLTRGDLQGGARNAVVMGRRTWSSLPDDRRPLADRLNVVLTRNPALSLPPGASAASGLDQALAHLAALSHLGQVFVIGGAEVFQVALCHPRLAQVHLTRIEAAFDCDTFLPPLPPDLILLSRSPPRSEAGLTYHHCLLRRPPGPSP